MHISEHHKLDIVIMGAGLAGLTAALTMAERHPMLKVAVLSKVHPLRTGDGMSLCLRAGAQLKDIEFFQIHPTGLPNGILITEGARGEGATLVNAKGERFMQRYAPEFMELAPRDLVARSIQTEINEGRGCADGCVRLDLTRLGEQKINARLPQIRDISINFAGVDPVHEPIPVRPTTVAGAPSAGWWTATAMPTASKCAPKMSGPCERSTSFASSSGSPARFQVT